MKKTVIFLVMTVAITTTMLAEELFPRHFMVIRTTDGTHKILAHDITNIKFDVVNDNSSSDSDTSDTDQNQATTFSFVDLGLESGTLWATTNLGATNPEENGYYISWGETTPKENYTEEFYAADLASLPDNVSATKYDPSFQMSNHEAAMPTDAQFKELVASCTWQWENLSGVDGFRVTGNNGNSIFIPAGGFFRGEKHMNNKIDCCYWSSTKYSEDRAFSLAATYIDFIGNDFLYPVDLIYEGRLIRPVKYQGPPVVDPDYTMVISAGGMEISLYNTDIESCSIEIENIPYTTDDAVGVDLGLPSGILWADRNIGASKEMDSGLYFSWGEVSQRDTHSEDSYLHYDNESKKYDCLGYSIASTEYDAATRIWGDHWVMPTINDVKELIEYTTHEIIENGMAVKLTGNNGNSIIIPLAGLSSNGSIEFAGQFGYYHTATSNQKDQWSTPSMVIDNIGPTTFTGSKWVGQNIRPVWK